MNQEDLENTQIFEEHGGNKGHMSGLIAFNTLNRTDLAGYERDLRRAGGIEGV